MGCEDVREREESVGDEGSIRMGCEGVRGECEVVRKSGESVG